MQDGLTISCSGYRNFNNYEITTSILSRYNLKMVHVGDCRGADACVIQYCRNNNIPCTVFRANWDKYSKAAGSRRNEELITNTQLLIAFLSPDSRGTKNAISIAERKNIPIHTYNI